MTDMAARHKKLQQLGAIKNLYFDHYYAQSAYRRIQDFHNISRNSKSSDFLVLYGESGCGKTQLLERYRRYWSEANKRPKGKERILFVSVPSSCSPKALAEAILTALEDPFARNGTLNSMTLRAAHLIRELQVSLIILDEFHHFINKRNMRVVYEAADWLKALANGVECPFLAAGLPLTTVVLARNEQLERRVVGSVEIPQFGVATKVERQHFCTILALFAQELPFDNPEYLVSQNLDVAIHRATGGIIGRVARLLRRVGEIGVDRDSAVLKLEYFFEAYAELSSMENDYNSKENNPFSLKPVKRKRKSVNLSIDEDKSEL